MIKVVTAPEKADAFGLPVLFLAGPIQSAEKWQDKAIEFMLSEFDFHADFIIANPRRNVDTEGEFSKEMYEEQVDWEHLWLENARRYGSATLFWLASQSTENKNRAYAQTSRFELGEAMVDHTVYNSKLIVGIEEGFTGARYIRYTLSKKTQDVPILETLEDTCRHAAKWLDIWGNLAKYGKK